MMRRKVFMKVFVLFALFLLTALSAAAQSQETLYPTLIDLAGWKGKAPDGMKMDMGGMKMATAVRTYTQGSKKVNATIIIGNPGMAGAMTGRGGGTQMDTSKGKMEARTINGFQVQLIFDKVNNSGMIMVMLAPGEQGGALFSLVYEGCPEDEGLALAKRFDWAKMKGLAKAFE